MSAFPLDLLAHPSNRPCMTIIQKRLLGLDKVERAALMEEWQSLAQSQAPMVPARVLRQLVAYKLQEKAFGGLKKRTLKALEHLAMHHKGEVTPTPPASRLAPGTRLVREWNGKTIIVEVRDEGFRYADKDWNSLSEIARHVTGSHWSGPRFFGLTSKHAASNG